MYQPQIWDNLLVAAVVNVFVSCVVDLFLEM